MYKLLKRSKYFHIYMYYVFNASVITGHDILIYSVPLIFGTSRVSSDRDDWHSLSAGYYLFIRRAAIANLVVAWIYLYPYYFNKILCIIPMLLLLNTWLTVKAHPDADACCSETLMHAVSGGPFRNEIPLLFSLQF